MKVFRLLVLLNLLTVFALTLASSLAPAQPGLAPEDSYLSLEDSGLTSTQSWAKSETAKSRSILEGDPRFAPLKERIQKVVTTPGRLPEVTYLHGMVYRFWQDLVHVHGIFQRISVSDFQAGRESWEILLDLDLLSQTESKSWVWQSAKALQSNDNLWLVSLSPDGGDASVWREYDMEKRQFVQDGFQLPAAKSNLTWISVNEVLVSTDFGPGTMTQSGYPAILKLWKRGQPLREAETVLQGVASDISVSGDAALDMTENGLQTRVLLSRNIDFFNSESYWLNGRELVRLPFPGTTSIYLGGGGNAFALLKEDWSYQGQVYASGSLLTLPLRQVREAAPTVIFRPQGNVFIADWQLSGDVLYLSLLENVQARLKRATRVNGNWQLTEVELPPMGKLALGISGFLDQDLLFRFESFLTPATIYRFKPTANTPEVIRSAPATFDSSPFTAEQFWTVSKDGTRIPYFILHRKDYKLDGQNPTLQYGYGGFEDSLTPWYSGSIAQAWLNQGGVYVVANIRGGGEFGPGWHLAAIKENKQKSYDDFVAVSEDLIRRGVTRPERLGIEGGSNGGLLVGAVLVERPDLYNAVVCEVPLLDMIRYPLLAAGASWVAEYGDPNDLAMREKILGYSPYQNVKAGIHYPKVLFMTSATDDRVGPAHARKMAAKMLDFGDQVLFFEDSEGGHSGADSLAELVQTTSLSYTFLYQQLMSPTQR